MTASTGIASKVRGGPFKGSKDRSPGKEGDGMGTPQHYDAGAESDVDELVDSDAEKNDAAARPTAKSQREKKGSGNTQNGATGANGAGRKTTNVSTTVSPPDGRATPSNGNANASPAKGINGSNVSPEYSNRHAMEHSSNGNDVRSPSYGHALRRDKVSPSPHGPEYGEQRDGNPRTAAPSREMSGRTATGGPVPYYYPTSNAQGAHSSVSPHPASAVPRKSAQVASGSGKATKTKPSSLDGEEMTDQEADKFLDLIEKHCHDTGAHEGAWSRSVIKLYQEWLEWCAKRNVVGTKSKEGLISEFPRIYQGLYGQSRQSRAANIVQRGSPDGNGAHHPLLGGRLDGRSGYDPMHDGDDMRGMAYDAHSRYAPGGGPGEVQRSPLESNHAFVDGIPPHVVDHIRLRIRDEVLQEASAMVTQVVRDHMLDLVAENRTMAARIEQLEVHSDNLAQWVQHLNRVQEDQGAALSSLHRYPAAVPPQRGDRPPPPEEMMGPPPGGPPMEFRGGGGAGGPFPPPEIVPNGAGPGAGPGYPMPPNYGGPGPHPVYRSPEEAYRGLRRSPSPSMSHRAMPRGGRPGPVPPPGEFYDGPVKRMPPGAGHDGPPMHMAAHPGYHGSPGMMNAPLPNHGHGHPAGPHPDEAMRGGVPPLPPQHHDGRGGMQGGYPPPGPDPRRDHGPPHGGYYGGGPPPPHFDDRMGPMPSEPPVMESRLSKRPRKGY